MEEEAMEWDNQGYDVEEDNGNMTWIWKKSLAMGKKILITGFVITSAPVVLPPLVVISTLGLACAVPYGLLLVSYACTEQLMTTLLPRPKKPVTFEELGTRADDEKHGRDAIVPVTFEELGTKDDDDVEKEEEELKQRVEKRIEQEDEENEKVAKGDEKSPEEIVGVVIGIEGEDKSNNNVREEAAPLPFEVTEVTVELCQTDEPERNEELVKESRGLIENIKNEGLSEGGAGENKQSGESELKGGKGKKGRSRKTKGKGKSNEEAAKDKEEIKTTDKNVEETVTASGDTNVDGGKTQESVDNHVEQNQKLGTDNADDKKAVHIEFSAESGTPEGSDQLRYKNVEVVEITVPSSVQATDSGGVASSEDLYSEGKIWKQIDAMRAIVGYAAARRATCVEELKSLYVYTGVEPPASFKDPSDLVEINAKLRFLMSIVGVK